jgi:putative endonuclease
MSAWICILQLKSGSLYVGATTNLIRRYQEHCCGNGCRTTSIDPPVCLLYSEEYESLSAARKRETQIKRWSRAKKQALMSGDLATLRNLARSK